MKSLKLLLALLMSTALFSCSDSDDVTVTLKEYGTITIQVLTPDKKPLAEAEVFIYLDNYGNQELFKLVTDQNGICKTEQMLQRAYYCFVKGKVNNTTYVKSQVIQAIAGEDRSIEITTVEQ